VRRGVRDRTVAAMPSVTVCTVIRRPREAVFDHLDDLAMHEAFTDHFLVDWSLTRDDSRGVGAGARMRAKGGGRDPWITIIVVDSVRPERTVEEGRGGKDGRRRTRGIYELAEEPDGATKVCFTNEFEPVGFRERLQAPLARAYLRRQNARALGRLKSILEQA
jgi:Polyketide cyclase / dehydrase and lipid transport